MNMFFTSKDEECVYTRFPTLVLTDMESEQRCNLGKGTMDYFLSGCFYAPGLIYNDFFITKIKQITKFQTIKLYSK